MLQQGGKIVIIGVNHNLGTRGYNDGRLFFLDNGRGLDHIPRFQKFSVVARGFHKSFKVFEVDLSVFP